MGILKREAIYRTSFQEMQYSIHHISTKQLGSLLFTSFSLKEIHLLRNANI